MLDPLSSPDLEATSNPNLVFIDPQLNNYTDFVSGVEPAEAVILDRENDMAQIASSISEYQTISCDREENHQMETVKSNIDIIGEHSEELPQRSHHLDRDADFLLMGCQIGTDAEFVESSIASNKADVAAENLIGYKDLNGDWQQEIDFGEIESKLGIDSETLWYDRSDLELSLHDRAISDTEVSSLADSEQPSDSNKLVAQLKLDEIAGNLAEDSQDTTRGILHNGAFFEPVGGDLGNGVRFDGDDDLVTLASSTEINFDVHSQRTISVWFNADDIDRDTPQVIYEEGGGGRGLNIYLDRGQLYVGGWNRIESKWKETFLNSDRISSDNWHHVALVLDAPQTDTVQPDVLFAYLDGEEFGRGSGSQLWQHGAIGLGGVNSSTRFHRNNVDSKDINGFAGNIASLEIYNQALNSETINNLSDLKTPQKFTADHEYFNYDGRIDWQNPQAPALGYPGTSIELKFIGTKLQIELSEDSFGRENYIDVYLDDNPEPTKIKLRREGGQPVTYDIAEGLEDKVHNAVIYKRNDYSTGEFKFHSVTIDGQLLPANPDSQRTIEVYGDSISAGIAVEYPIPGVPDPDIQDKSGLANAYYSYGSILARKYDAEVSLVAQAGISLVDGFSRNRFWQDIGGQTIYDKVKPLEDADLWNFNNYSPDLVIIAYGQNDAASVGDSLSKEEWKEHYKQMIANLRDKHPDSYFIGMFPAMNHNRQWDSYITEAIAEYRLEYHDERVFSLIHEQVTPGHPRISEQETMADTLQEFIDGTLTDNGFSWDID